MIKKTRPKPSKIPVEGSTLKGSFLKGEMSFLAHLEELRKLLIRSVIIFFLFAGVAYFFYDQIVNFLTKPFLALNASTGEGAGKLYVNSVLEGLMVKLKVTFLFGLVFSFPIHLYHVMRFVFPALHGHEKKIIASLLGVSTLFIFLSIYYSYGYIIPISITFLTGVGFIPENVGMLLGFRGNVLFVFQFILISLVIFQLPIVLQLLLLFNVVKRKSLKKHMRSIVLVIFFLSAIVTPPDPVSLMAVAFPLVGMFMGALFIATVFRLGEGE